MNFLYLRFTSYPHWRKDKPRHYLINIFKELIQHL